MRSYMSLLLVAGLVTVCLAAALRGDEEKVSLKDLPAAVKATIIKVAGDLPIQEIEKETEGDKTVYEAEISVRGVEIDIVVSPDGKILAVEIELEDEDEGEEEEEDGDDEDDDEEDEDDDEDDDEDEDEEN